MTESEIQTIANVNEISNKFLQDLIWLLLIPSISYKKIDSSLHYSFANSESLTPLLKWQADLKLDEKLQPRANLPLGKYAEELIAFYLSQQSNYQLLANNVQLIEDNQTIGELDFLFKDNDLEKYIHLEFAIKYYLKVQFNGEERFLGPSTKDWFQRKLEKLTSKQVRHTINYKHLLPHDMQSIDFKPKIVVKGVLFYAYDDWVSLKAEQVFSSAWWIGIEHIEKLNFKGHSFQLIEKRRDWIFPFRLRDSFFTFDEAVEDMNAAFLNRNEFMMVRYDENKQAKDFGFVVRKAWPN